MFENYRRTLDEVEEINLLPVMNLFVVLIPFLLAAAAFFHVSVIPASTPQHTPQASSQASELDQVTLNIVIEPERFVVTASNSAIAFEDLEALGFELPSREGSYDTTTLQAKLRELKQRFPASNTAVVVPHDGLDYQTLVDILDHVRERRTGPESSEPLFPFTVFSQLVPPEPAPEGEAAPAGEAPP